MASSSMLTTDFEGAYILKTAQKRAATDNIKVLEDYTPQDVEVATESSTPTGLCEERKSVKAGRTLKDLKRRAALLEGKIKKSVEGEKETVSRKLVALVREMNDFSEENNCQIQHLKVRIQAFHQETRALAKAVTATSSCPGPLPPHETPNPPVPLPCRLASPYPLPSPYSGNQLYPSLPSPLAATPKPCLPCTKSNPAFSKPSAPADPPAFGPKLPISP